MALVAAVLMSVAAARAQEVTVVGDVLGPEGPLFVDGNLYYVAWTPGTLSRWDGKTSVVLNDLKGCSHNGLALTKRKTFLVACSDEHGSILELDTSGKLLRRWDADSKGRPLDGGINDVVVTANGGAYATVFGPFQAVPTVVVGKILYLAPGKTKWVEVARDLNYANGIGVSPDQKTLYVSEMVSNAILKFNVNADGTLSGRSNFARLDVLTPNASRSWWLGPDSFKVDAEGNLYVAQYAGRKVLKIAPDGKLRHVFGIAAGAAPTNVAFGPGEKDLYVTVVNDPDDLKGAGCIVKIPNVEAAPTPEIRSLSPR